MNTPHSRSTETPIQAFARLCSQKAELGAYPKSVDVVENVVIYEGDRFRNCDAEDDLKLELAGCLKHGPGVFVVRAAYEDLSVVDRSTRSFQQIAVEEQAAGRGRGDHFGNNERIWNSLQKVCVADPDNFIDYYANPILRLACEAWLGPHYQVTAQMNNVKPGGKAQSAHRDYHLGFQSAETIAKYPAHAQVMSQYLTLQGAVAHGDMPIASGPTMVLPFSQQYEAGYMAYQRPEFAAFFEEHRVQLPLAKGDMIFFSPAVFHAGGSNSTDHDRVANLLQVSSAFGRTMESLDNRKMIESVYAVLQHRKLLGAPERMIRDAIAVVANGYSFPTNLDTDPPMDGNAPATQQDILRLALEESWTQQRLTEQLTRYDQRRRA